MARSAAQRDPSPKENRSGMDRKPRAERWEELLEAAAKVFYEKGYDGASIQDIAERVKILKGSIYYYIQTKADLRDHLLVEVHSAGLAMISRLARAEGTALDKLEAIIRAHVDYMHRNRAKTAVYLQEVRKLSAEKRAALLGPRHYRQVFDELIALGQAEGLILPHLDPKQAGRAMVASLNSYYEWYRPNRETQGRVTDHFVMTLLRGHATDEGLRQLERVNLKWKPVQASDALQNL